MEKSFFRKWLKKCLIMNNCVETRFQKWMKKVVDKAVEKMLIRNRAILYW